MLFWFCRLQIYYRKPLSQVWHEKAFIEQELKDIFIIRSKIQDAVFSGLCCINLFNQSFENHPNSKLLVCSLKMDEFPLMKITLKQLTCSVHPLIISYISPKALLISIL